VHGRNKKYKKGKKKNTGTVATETEKGK